MTSIFAPPHPRRRALALACALGIGLAACSQPQEDETAAEGAAEMAEGAEAAADAAGEARSESAVAAPGANPNVAPGVAFAYQLAFRLPDAAVADAQERHVAACGALGPRQCRVTGMNYDQDQDGIIQASLQLMVDPAQARSFARDAADVVERLDGTLETSSVNGDDVGTGITQSQQHSARLGGDVERLRERLRQPGLTANERRDLQAQISEIEGELSGEEQVRSAGEARLASTPINFSYSGERGVGGLNRERPFASAWEASSESFANASAFVLMLLGLLLPWTLLFGGGFVLLRWLKRRNARVITPTPTE
jgi:hypothetical protein